MKKVGGHRTSAAGRGCNALGRTLKRRGSQARQDKGGGKSPKAELYATVSGDIVKVWSNVSAAGIEGIAVITAKIARSVLHGGYKKWYNSRR